MAVSLLRPADKFIAAILADGQAGQQVRPVVGPARLCGADFDSGLNSVKKFLRPSELFLTTFGVA